MICKIGEALGFDIYEYDRQIDGLFRYVIHRSEKEWEHFHSHWYSVDECVEIITNVRCRLFPIKPKTMKMKYYGKFLYAHARVSDDIDYINLLLNSCNSKTYRAKIMSVKNKRMVSQ